MKNDNNLLLCKKYRVCNGKILDLISDGKIFRLIVLMRPVGAALTSDRKSNEITKVTEKRINLPKCLI